MIAPLVRWCLVAIVCIAALSTAATAAFAGGGVLQGRSTGLSRWGGATTLPAPIGPVRPIHPIHPIHPINPWPWWGPNVVVYNPYSFGFGNYFYPPTRWDMPAWDGQVRDTTPPPAPREPRTPQRPLVMEWNSAKGRADVVHLDRWDGPTAKTIELQPAPPVEAQPPATQALHRWDAP